MAPRKVRKPAREEFEVPAYTNERARPLQARPPRRRASDFPDSGITAHTHAEEEPASEKKYAAPPPEDRAG